MAGRIENKTVVLEVSKLRVSWDRKYFAGFDNMGRVRSRFTLSFAHRFAVSDIKGITKTRKRLIEKGYAHRLRVAVA